VVLGLNPSFSETFSPLVYGGEGKVVNVSYIAMAWSTVTGALEIKQCVPGFGKGNTYPLLVHARPDLAR
jgi:hypothetical protein